MAVHNFNVVCVGAGPRETNTELVVNAYAPLTSAIARKALQAISRRLPHVRYTRCSIELCQLPHCRRRIEGGNTRDIPDLNTSSVAAPRKLLITK